MSKLPVKKHDFKDPFNAGQMIGMLMILSVVDRQRGIDEEFLRKLKWQTAENASIFLEIPAEDVHLHVNKLIKRELKL